MTSKPFSLAVKAVIVDAQGRCLLVRRSRENRAFTGAWEWPGGKVDAGETFDAAVIRETREETSLTVEITGLAGATQFEMPNVHVILLCMEARITGGEVKLSDEHDASAWVPLDELGSQELPPPIRDFMLDYARRKK
ncbi:MAG TPA: NUDIX domain-containing protein [Verrucomicrobiae bacterium]|jgi:8-oxo-dGTP diphosphatase